MSIDVRQSVPGTYRGEAFTHAPTAAVRPAGDDRTVGELLVDADYQARTLLIDVSAEDAAGLLRTWTDTVASAGELWRSLPGEKFAPRGSLRLLERLEEHAASVATDLLSARWPGEGPGDLQLTTVGANFSRARELVERLGGDVEPRHLPVRGDLEAARTRIIHVLYVATHGVLVALNAEGRRRASNPTRAEANHADKTPARSIYEVGPGVRWAQRLNVAERALGDYLTPGRYAGALSAEHTPPATGLPRLREALARFDIQAHRTMTQAPEAGNIVLAARTEGMLLAAALLIIRADRSPSGGEGSGRARNHDDSARVEDALTVAGSAWTDLARRWRDLMVPGTPIDPALTGAAAGLRAACRELTHDGDHLAAPTVIAGRVDVAEGRTVIAHYLAAGTDVAEATRPPLRDPALTAPVRAVLHRLAQDVEDGHLPNTVESVGEQFTAAAVSTNRLVPVPQPLVDALDQAAARAGQSSSVAARHALDKSSQVPSRLPPETASPGSRLPADREYRRESSHGYGLSNSQGNAAPRR